MPERVVIYVDVDDTLVRSAGTKQIPIPAMVRHVRELVADGCELYCWSTGGAAYAEATATRLGIADAFTGFLPKPHVIIDDQDIDEWRRCTQVHPLTAASNAGLEADAYRHANTPSQEDTDGVTVASSGPMNVEWRRAASYVVCRDQLGRLLLTRFTSPGNPDSGKWTMPGGGMEWGESAEDTAHRELAEETGLSATLGQVLGVYSRWLTEQESAADEAGHVIGIVYQAEQWHGQLRTTFDDGTTDAAHWFPVEDIPAIPHVGLVDLVLDLIT